MICRFLGLFIATILLPIGCSSPRYRYTDHLNYITTGRLRNLADQLILVAAAGDDVAKYTSVDAIIKEWQEYELLNEREARELRCDWWEQPFHYESTKTDTHLIIRISSNGSNRIDEGGKGDDHFVKIVFSLDFHGDPPMYACEGRGNGQRFRHERWWTPQGFEEEKPKPKK
jgi:hypothetical protein